MIKIPEGLIIRIGIPGVSPASIREELIEYNVEPRSSILIALGAIGITLGVLCWQEIIPNYYLGGGGYLQGVGFVYGISCLILGLLPHIALLIVVVFVGILIISAFLFDFPPDETFLKLPYSYWMIIGFAGILLFILFVDIKYTMRRKRRKVGKEVDQYLKNLRDGIRSF